MRMVDRARDERVIAYVRARGTVSVVELSRELGVGPSTIRRDLSRLAGEDRLVRTYGGATLADRPAAVAPGGPIRALGEKRRVAAAAARLVQDGQTIAVTSGTTAVEFARQLVDRTDLTVITNSLDVAQVLLDREGDPARRAGWRGPSPDAQPAGAPDRAGVPGDAGGHPVHGHRGNQP